MLFRNVICAFVSLFLGSVLTCQSLAIKTSAESAVLIEQQSGRVLYEQSADTEMLIASITKIMTAVVALERGDLSKAYTVTAQDMAEGSSMYLKVGETVTLEELLYGLMLASGNDAALAVAHCVSGDTSAFVDLMNQTAQKLGLVHTGFVNPNGLDAEGHYSSARDMAKLTAYALENEIFRRIVSTRSITIGDRVLKNHNKLLGLYEGCIGVKTGFTKAAGRTLVSAAERDGMTLVCVTLNDGDDWNDHRALFDYGFASYCLSTPVSVGQAMGYVLVHGGTKSKVSLVADSAISVPVAADEHLALKVRMPVSVAAPVIPGQVIGEISVYCNEVQIGAAKLIAVEPSDRTE